MHSQIAFTQVDTADVRARQAMLFAHLLLGRPVLAHVQANKLSVLYIRGAP